MADRNSTAPPRSFDDELRAHADALYRTAMECSRQRERYARLVGRDVDGVEQELSFDLACRCDALLDRLVRGYEQAAERVTTPLDGDWWHRANALWQASREYLRRHECADHDTRRLTGHSPERLGELRAVQDLEASALLALCFAAGAYRKVRPEAELKNGSSV
jgi:hypothetical protein